MTTLEAPTHRRGLPGRAAAGLVVLAAFSAACSGDAPGPTQPPPGGGSTTYDHLRGPGASARDLLRSTDFDRLVVQVQYVAGFRPSDEGLAHLRTFLETHLDKPGGVVIQVDAPLSVAPRATYSPADVRALEAAHRTVYTQGTTLATYLLFLDGEYADAANVLGIAYNNTSMAVFQERIEANTGGPLEPTAAVVEGTVANHELGHLLGLVNTGSPMQVEHQDEAHGAHCDDQQCLMYYAVRTTDFLANLVGGMPSLDQDCLDDLEANRGS